ncbi:uncharacterized protein N7496_003121, partial [Penicillium cataractarum]
TQHGWVQDQKNQLGTTKEQCTLQISEGPYCNLQFALNSCSHTQNMVLADQSKCDKKLTLHEFVAYGSLRAGEQLQWYNMLRELASSSLSFNEPPVVQLFKQAAWEFGSFYHDTMQRVSHRAFEDSNFCGRLLEVLRRRLEMIEGNWNEHAALNLLVTLGVRSFCFSGGYLSSQESQSFILEGFAKFLRDCREVALDWCEQLSHDLHGRDKDQSQRYQDLILKIAKLTYDVDSNRIGWILHSARDIFCLIRSSILLFENSASDIDRLSHNDLKLALQNAQRIRCLLKDQVFSIVSENPAGLNEAVGRILWYLNSSQTWEQCNGADGWLSACPEGTSQILQQQIHFDVLMGELLVDGTPPGRLPQRFTANGMYQRLFGCTALPVMPSNLPGISFVSAQLCGEFEVHFGISKENQVFIRARSPTHLLQLLPQTLLTGDFPDQFVTEYFQWVDLQTGVIEFRALGQPWEINLNDWHARPDQLKKLLWKRGRRHWSMYTASCFLKLRVSCSHWTPRSIWSL